MKIIVGQYPPLIDQIDEVFDVRHKTVFFAWGDTIYNPLGKSINPEIIAHEKMHGQRQGNDIKGWWLRYIADQKFRMIEEFLGHAAEYNHLLNMHGVGRNARRVTLAKTAERFVHPLYRYQPRPKLHYVKEVIVKLRDDIAKTGYVPTWTENSNFLAL